MNDDSLTGLTRMLTQILMQKKIRVVTAESCTGGALSEVLTRLSGSSVWFERGFVTYSNEAKIEILGVRKESLVQYGAVSVEVAHEMATGALNHSHADIAISITGIAGPTGGTVDKPVGTVCISWRSNGELDLTKRFLFKGDRAAIREQSCVTAITTLTDLLEL